ncbi:MAG: sce7726 family protein [Bacillota bacterium]|nr:sce7726 family protein [Bacillota bacterium]
MLYDGDIRKALVNQLPCIPGFASDDTWIVHELDVCGGVSRVDLAVINGKLHGFEIKSERDNLERLPLQMENYNHIFNTMTIVTTHKHIDGVMNIIPDWWGVVIAEDLDNDVSLYVEHKPSFNPNVDGFRLAQLLWREELMGLLVDKRGSTKGLKSKTRRELARLVSQYLDLDELENSVHSTLKGRPGWKAHQLQPLYGD